MEVRKRTRRTAAKHRLAIAASTSPSGARTLVLRRGLVGVRLSAGDVVPVGKAAQLVGLGVGRIGNILEFELRGQVGEGGAPAALGVVVDCRQRERGHFRVDGGESRQAGSFGKIVLLPNVEMIALRRFFA